MPTIFHVLFTMRGSGIESGGAGCGGSVCACGNSRGGSDSSGEESSPCIDGGGGVTSSLQFGQTAAIPRTLTRVPQCWQSKSAMGQSPVNGPPQCHRTSIPAKGRNGRDGCSGVY